MKHLFKGVLFTVVASLLLGCNSYTDENYIISNKTNKAIGFFASHVNYISVNNVQIAPQKEFIQNEKVYGYGRGIPGFKVSNLVDTTSITVSQEKAGLILDDKLTTHTDTIIRSVLTVSGALSYSWIVTDELLSIMEHDESLLTEFAQFYTK